jgi:hypothetical protein
LSGASEDSIGGEDGKRVSERVIESNWNVAIGASPIVTVTCADHTENGRRHSRSLGQRLNRVAVGAVQESGNGMARQRLIGWKKRRQRYGANLP